MFFVVNVKMSLRLGNILKHIKELPLRDFKITFDCDEDVKTLMSH